MEIIDEMKPLDKGLGIRESNGNCALLCNSAHE